ncbi:MAG: DMT family transporter [Anaerolineae bacterium]|nr:DMT family transporter [Anaerolineae bacterium]
MNLKGQSFSAHDKWVGHLCLLGSALLMGSAYVGAKLALQGVGPLATAFLRFLIACIITWPVLFFTHGVQPIRKEHIIYFIGHGLFQTTIYFSLQYVALRYTTANNTALIVNTRPIFLALLAMIFFKERFSFVQWIAFFLSFIGVLVILYDPAASYMPGHLFGDFLIVLNALSGALGVLFGKRLLKEYKPFTILVYQITIGMLGLLPMALIESGGQIALNQVSWGPIIFLAVFSTAIAQSLFNWGLSRLSVSSSAVYFFIIPAINLILAHFMFGEPITVFLLIGGGLIIAGMYGINHKNNTDEQVELINKTYE